MDLEMKKEPAVGKGEIVVYQPDEVTRLEVRVDKDTVWLTQSQIAALFGVKQPAVSKHIRNIYQSGELDYIDTYSILEHMGNDGQIFDAYVSVTKNIHDRFLIVDEDVYHIGASLKDLGKKLFAFSKINVTPSVLIQ